jgi:hypothetical protein
MESPSFRGNVAPWAQNDVGRGRDRGHNDVALRANEVSLRGNGILMCSCFHPLLYHEIPGFSTAFRGESWAFFEKKGFGWSFPWMEEEFRHFSNIISHFFA